MVFRYLPLIIGVLVVGLVAACQSGGGGSQNTGDNQTPRVIVQSTTTASNVGGGDTISAEVTAVLPAVPTATATPTVVLPDRTTCAEIQGTDYHSAQEREWYLANCIATPVPTATSVPLPGIPGPEVPGERWILVDIGTQTTTAMIGNTPYYTALVTTGADGWETPTGTWNIVYRVENETMTSESIGADEYYVLEDVLYTQYFTTEGHAIHLNYWRDDSYFGNIRSSHGCIGMRLADAEFFWHFASHGTRITIQ